MAGWSLEELAQAESGPGRTALEWVEAVKAQETDRVWRLMDPDFRLVNVQGWITHNEEVLRDPAVGGLDRETFAHELASEHPTHPLWRHCARVTLREITQACGGFERRELGIGARTRPIGPDLELVRMFPLDEMDQDETGQHYFASGASVVVLSILCSCFGVMRRG